MKTKYLTEPFKKIFDYKGRSSLKEYWMFYLWTVIILASLAALSLFSYAMGDDVGNVALTILVIPVFLFLLAHSLVSFSLFVRRLHDTNKSGWYYLINFIPFGNVVLLIFVLTRGDPFDNNYGPNPEQQITKFENLVENQNTNRIS